MPNTKTDAALWYNVGEFGEKGYAVPNWGNDYGSLNQNVLDLCDLIGRNVFAMMHHEDADLRRPPFLNTLQRVHKLYIRVGHILTGRAIKSGELNMETDHVTPGGGVYRVYPCPYFKVRNAMLYRWCGWAFTAMSEAMQHTENRRTIEISDQFAGKIGQYFTRIYHNMAIECFNKTPEQVKVDGFVLTDADFANYAPEDFFTSTELVDTVPPLDLVFTEDRLRVLAEGIPVTQLPDLAPYPVNLTSYYELLRATGEQGGGTISDTESATSAGTRAGPIFPPPPGP